MIQLATLEDVPRSRAQRSLRRYRDEMRKALWIGGGSLSIPGDPFAAAQGFNGNFASIFPGALQVVQTDLGLTYGTTLLDTGGTGPVLTFGGGTLAGPPIPIWVKCTLSGARGVWTYEVYYDGTGTTPAMSGTSSGLPIVLTGAGAGMSISIAAGNATNGNIWKATASQLTDQSGSGNHAVQATPSAQPILTTGVNGIAGLSFDGVTQTLTTALALSPPGTAAAFFCGGYRLLSVPGAAAMILGVVGSAGMSTYHAGAATPQQYNGNNANLNTGALGSWRRFESYFSNSVADYTKFGSNKVTGGNAGNIAQGATRYIAHNGGTGPLNMEFLFAVIQLGLPSAGQLAAADAAVTSKYAGLVAV